MALISLRTSEYTRHHSLERVEYHRVVRYDEVCVLGQRLVDYLLRYIKAAGYAGDVLR